MSDTPSSAELSNPTVHHEHSDINIAAVFKFAVGLTVIAAAVHVAIWLMLGWFQATAASADVRNPLRVAEDDVRVPPEPRLQIEPRQDLDAYQVREAALLDGYHWIDKNAGVVRIPIAEAMKKVVERGLPTRSVQESSQSK
jgi:hypothetical protein